MLSSNQLILNRKGNANFERGLCVDGFFISARFTNLENNMIKITEGTKRKLFLHGLISSSLLSLSYSSSAIEEVIVTAHKRDQPIVEIPVSVDVIEGESLQGAGLISLEDVTTSLPAVFVANNSNATIYAGYLSVV